MCSGEKHLRAKYGAAGKECVEVDVADLRKLQTLLYDLADPQFTTVYAESQDDKRKRHDSIDTLTVHWAILQSNVTSWTSRVLRDGLCHEACSRKQPCCWSTERSRVVSIATHGLCLSDLTDDCVSTLEFVCEKYRSPARAITSLASPALTLEPRDSKF